MPKLQYTPQRLKQVKRLQMKRVLLQFERLEPRQLLASDLGDIVPLFNDATGTDTSAIQQAAKETTQDLRTQKPTHTYSADGQEVGLVVFPKRFAIEFSDGNQPDSMSLNSLKLTFVRKVNDEFSVYDSVETADVLRANSSVSEVVPVFYAPESNSEAVLLDEIIVSLKPGVTAAAYFAGNATFSAYRPLVGTPDQFVATVSAGKGEAALAVVNEIASDARLNWVAPNFYQTWQKFYTPNDTRFTNQWHLNNTGQSGGLVDADSDLPEAWDVVQGGSPSYVIGIVDDGITLDHPDLTPWINVGEIAGNLADDDGNGWVDDINGWNFVANNNQSFGTTADDVHGTAVSGVAAAKGDNAEGVAGSSYNSQVMSARIFEGAAVASDANIAAALYYVGGRTANGLGTWRASDLVNNSWGGGASSTAINAALTWGTTLGRQGRGAPYLFATGNGFAAVSQPALQSLTIPGVIAVGATNNKGERSDYSNFGPAVDIVTPSNDTRAGYLAIDTTDRVGADGYAAGNYTGTGATGFGGTSSATPLATGITALAMFRADTLGVTLTPAQIRAVVRNNTDLIGGATYDPITGKNNEFGFGRLNAASVVSNIGKPEISVLSPTVDLESGVSNLTAPSTFLGEFTDMVFRVRNQGTSVLNLGALTVSGPFSVLAGFASTALDIGGSTTFSIRFTPTAGGSFTRAVTIASNDTSEASFVFNVTATGIAPSIGGAVFEDWDGDSVFDAQDTRLAGRAVFLDANTNGTLDSVPVSYSNTATTTILDVATVTSTINVSGFANFIADLNVRINITHTFDADLNLTLISPAGLRVPLFAGVGGSGDNFVNTVLDDEATTAIAAGAAPFTGSFRPSGSLSAFDGVSANGVWTLEIVDTAAGDVGTLNNWRLDFLDGEQSTQTRANGFYAFVNLPAATYSVKSIPPTNWAASGSNLQVVTLATATDSIVGRDFGSGLNNRFYGQVFDDANGDGVFQSTEAPLPGRVIYLDANGNGTFESPVSSNFVNSTALVVADLSTVNSTMVVSGVSGGIQDVNVKVNITMSFDADLDVFLVHPDGTRVELFTDVGGGGANFTNTVLDDQAATAITAGAAPFTGSFRPEGILGTLNTKTANGTWRLELTDDASGDVATLNSWELTIGAGERSITTSSLGNASLDLPAGTYAMRLAPLAGWLNTVPASGLRSVTPSGTPLFDQRYGTQLNVAPSIAVNNPAVVGIEGTTLTNSGTWADLNVNDVVTLSASVGNIVKNANGTWSWSHSAPDNLPTTSVTVTATDSLGLIATVNFTFIANNLAPSVAAINSSVSGNLLTTISNTGTYADVATDTVTLTTSHGTIVNHNNGTWTWSISPTAVFVNQTVTVTATDEDGGASTATFTLNAYSVVSGRTVFYKGSGFESVGGVAGALDSSKVILQSGATSQTTSPANVSNYVRGINGVVLGVTGLVASTLTASDFIFRVAPPGAAGVVNPSTWANAPAPSAILVTAAAGATPAQVRLEWPDNAIENTWLQIIVRANANTGLGTSPAFYIGNAAGDVNLVPISGGYRIGVPDLTAVQSAVSSALVPINNNIDIDKNRRVGIPDLSFVQSHQSSTIVLLRDITIPAAGSPAENSLISSGGGKDSSGNGSSGIEKSSSSGAAPTPLSFTVQSGSSLSSSVQAGRSGQPDPIPAAGASMTAPASQMQSAKLTSVSVSLPIESNLPKVAEDHFFADLGELSISLKKNITRLS